MDYKKIKKKKTILIFLIILIIFISDQATKYYIISYYDTNLNIIKLSSFLNLDLIWNDGIAFGLLGFENAYIYNAITAIICLVILLIIYLMFNENNKTSYYFSMIVGGAMGNLVDRIRYSSVPDFIDFHIKDIHWFIFNVADIFITIGVICLILKEFINNNYEKKSV